MKLAYEEPQRESILHLTRDSLDGKRITIPAQVRGAALSRVQCV